MINRVEKKDKSKLEILKNLLENYQEKKIKTTKAKIARELGWHRQTISYFFQTNKELSKYKNICENKILTEKEYFALKMEIEKKKKEGVKIFFTLNKNNLSYSKFQTLQLKYEKKVII